MKLPQLPLTELPQLLHFHPITLNGLSPVHLGGHPIDAGVALLFTPPHTPGKPLLTASPSLILSQSHVLTLSKSDRHLHDALVAAGEDLSQSPRGACMVLLLLRQSTAAGLATPLGSVRDAWLEYVQFLPTEIPLPTTWTSAELTLLAGTSLESAVAAKLRALNYEFEAYAKAVAALEWWDTEGLVLADWVHADALFRSRSLMVPGMGAAMVPVLDFANHAGAGEATARFEVGAGGEVVLELVGEWVEGKEVTIDYSGGEKSAAEMVFSYGFIPQDMSSAGSLTLDLPPSDDDPLGRAKTAAWGPPRTVRIYETASDAVAWEGDFAYLCVVNEEDSLSFHILQDTTGQRHLQVLFQSEELDLTHNPTGLLSLLRNSAMWPIFQLRAAVMLRERVEAQLTRLVASRAAEEEERIEDGRALGEGYRAQPFSVGTRLRALEETLLLRAVEMLQSQQDELISHPSVLSYLAQMQDTGTDPVDEPSIIQGSHDDDAGEIDLS